MDIKRIVRGKDTEPIKPGVDEEMPNADGCRASAKNVIEQEVDAIFEEDIRTAAKALVDEQKIEIRALVEEHKRVIREVLEEEMASIQRM